MKIRHAEGKVRFSQKKKISWTVLNRLRNGKTKKMLFTSSHSLRETPGWVQSLPVYLHTRLPCAWLDTAGSLLKI